MKDAAPDFIREFQECVPNGPTDEIDWDRIGRLLAPAGFTAMKETPQNPVFHGEGDVYRHMQLVCRELLLNPGFFGLSSGRRTALFLAALLHDIGKTKTTRCEGGVWISPNHSAAGSRIVRTFLWRDCALCGTPGAVAFREAVCALVRYHMLPVHLAEKEDAKRRVREIACIGELAAGFTPDLLLVLAEADVKGRIAGDTADLLERVQLAEILAEEAGCLDQPYRFGDAFTKRAYLSGRNVDPDQKLFDASWGEVVMLSGLPGTGKDTWIRENLPGMPVVSLDEIRKTKGIGPADNQGEVVWAAQEAAKAYLRKKQPFVWNATDTGRDTRQKLVTLFERYGARVRIIYLETGLNERIRRNAGRPEPVPEAAVGRMLERTVPPMPDEAQTVEWVCV